MNIRNILISGLGVMALTACNDFLDVDAPSKQTVDAVFGSSQEVNAALNGVYAKVMVNDAFGNSLYNTVMLNSDVDFTANSNENAQSNTPRRFDVTSSGSAVNKLWTALYDGVEAANEFIYNLEKSPIYSKKTSTSIKVDEFGNETTVSTPVVNEYTQMIGEAKMIRAMFYHELLSYWGDVPFTFLPTSVTEEFAPAIIDRQTISDALIEDLREIAEYMYSDKNISDAPERISKEAVYAMIARLALQAGGYSLNHDAGDTKGYYMKRPANYKDYYQIALTYTDKVIIAGGHSLAKSFPAVFTDECSYIANTGDDVIWEIPYGKDDTGNWGYYQGPTCSSSGGQTSYSQWGETSGSVRTTAFYMYDFEDGDARRDYTCGLWYYSATGLPTLRYDYAMHNNKWSKLWSSSAQGKESTGSTGINFAYIRYADVLLMNAEAANELDLQDQAKADLRIVRERAFRNSDPAKITKYDAVTDKEELLNAILDERKFEFAGENMRWKDLVRNNKYSETIYWEFLKYYSVGAEGAGWSDYYEEINEATGKDYASILPSNIYAFYVKNPGDGSLFVNNTLPVFYIVDPYGKADDPTATSVDKYITNNALPYTALTAKDITGSDSDVAKIAWTTAKVFSGSWGSDSGIKAQCLYSFYGYIRGGVRDGEIVLVYGANDVRTIEPYAIDAKQLPAVRYLLPLPNEALQRGGYTQHYGY